MSVAYTVMFLLAAGLAVPAFLLRLRESTRLLWRVLCFVALACLMTLGAGLDGGAWHWLLYALSVVYWLNAIGCWRRMEQAREREQFAALTFRLTHRKP